MIRNARALLFTGGLSVLVTACTTPPLPPEPPPRPTALPPVSTPPPPPEGPLPPSTPRAPEPDSPPPPLAEPLPPLTRTFQTVNLPNVNGPILSISGRGPNDIWLVENVVVEQQRFETGVVHHFDGKKTKSYGHPCLAANWSSVAAGDGVVAALGFRGWSRGVWPNFWATMTPDGNWHCDFADHGFRAGTIQSAGDRVFQVTCTESHQCGLAIVSGPPLAFPSMQEPIEDRESGDPPAYSAIFMSSASDGWLVNEHEDGRDWLYRYNGVTWRPLAPITEGTFAVGLWGDTLGNAWILVRDAESKDDEPAKLVLRWDGKKLSYMPVPASFQATMLRATGPDDVWLVGPNNRIYQWDGKALHQGKTPIDVRDGWGSPDGDLWLGGKAPTKNPDDETDGRLIHTGPRAEAKK